MQHKPRIVIVGAGMVGLACAVRLARNKLPVTVIEARLPALHWASTDYDARVSALNPSSEKLLSALGVWQQLSHDAIAPLHEMDVWDTLGGGEIRFDDWALHGDCLGHIVENREVVLCVMGVL